MPLGQTRRVSISKSSIGATKNVARQASAQRGHSRSKSSELIKVAVTNNQQQVGEIPQYQYKEVPSLDIQQQQMKRQETAELLVKMEEEKQRQLQEQKEKEEEQKKVNNDLA